MILINVQTHVHSTFQSNCGEWDRNLEQMCDTETAAGTPFLTDQTENRTSNLNLKEIAQRNLCHVSLPYT